MGELEEDLAQHVIVGVDSIYLIDILRTHHILHQAELIDQWLGQISGDWAGKFPEKVLPARA